jgi:hypothetical protein
LHFPFPSFATITSISFNGLFVGVLLGTWWSRKEKEFFSLLGISASLYAVDVRVHAYTAWPVDFAHSADAATITGW